MDINPQSGIHAHKKYKWYLSAHLLATLVTPVGTPSSGSTLDNTCIQIGLDLLKPSIDKLIDCLTDIVPSRTTIKKILYSTWVVRLRARSILLSWCPEILGRVLLLDPTHISKIYSIGKTLVCRTLEYLTLGTKTKTKHTRSIATQLCLLHSSCKITTNFFLLSIWAFHHCSILQIGV
jgi:hypothetical protein